MARNNESFPKSEHLCSRKIITKLFAGGNSRSMSAFPLRMVYMPLPEKEDGNTASQMLVSVPKRCFKRAVKRNRVKRQVREAYRKNKVIIDGRCLAIAFIWLDNKLYPSSVVTERMVNLLQRVAEKTTDDKEPCQTDKSLDK